MPRCVWFSRRMARDLWADTEILREALLRPASADRVKKVSEDYEPQRNPAWRETWPKPVLPTISRQSVPAWRSCAASPRAQADESDLQQDAPTHRARTARCQHPASSWSPGPPSSGGRGQPPRRVDLGRIVNWPSEPRRLIPARPGAAPACKVRGLPFRGRRGVGASLTSAGVMNP
jgi:hypothetical protein